MQWRIVARLSYDGNKNPSGQATVTTKTSEVLTAAGFAKPGTGVYELTCASEADAAAAVTAVTGRLFALQEPQVCLDHLILTIYPIA